MQQYNVATAASKDIRVLSFISFSWVVLFSWMVLEASPYLQLVYIIVDFLINTFSFRAFLLLSKGVGENQKKWWPLDF